MELQDPGAIATALRDLLGDLNALREAAAQLNPYERRLFAALVGDSTPATPSPTPKNPLDPSFANRPQPQELGEIIYYTGTKTWWGWDGTGGPVWKKFTTTAS